MTSSHLSSEIAEQPAVLRRLLDQEQENIERIAAAIRDYDPQYVVIAARGTSDNAARYGKYLFGAANRLSVALATPALFTLYQRPPCLENALVLGISQSGASPDIVSVIQEGRRQGALTVVVTNDPGSPLAAAAAHTLQLHTGVEQSIAATKTYTASLMAMAMLSTALAEDEACWQALWSLPAIASKVTEIIPDTIRAAERYRYANSCIVVGRGYNYATGFEIALKLKELTYVLADPYSPADLQHGPIALVERGFPAILIVPEGNVTAEMTDCLKQVRERGAETIVISALADALALAHTPLSVPEGIPEWLSPVVNVIPGQIFGLGLALAKGLDPDHPRGLHKVTLTR
jgi:glucosamine--fructose-6-phosphate aminotransferase (isomerizing)